MAPERLLPEAGSRVMYSKTFYLKTQALWMLGERGWNLALASLALKICTPKNVETCYIEVSSHLHNRSCMLWAYLLSNDCLTWDHKRPTPLFQGKTDMWNN